MDIQAKETNCNESSSDGESEDSFINDEEIEASESEEEEAWPSSQKRTPPKQPPQSTEIEIISDDEVLTTLSPFLPLTLI